VASAGVDVLGVFAPVLGDAHRVDWVPIAMGTGQKAPL